MIKYYIKGTLYQSIKNSKANPKQYRSSRSPMLFKIGARKNFANPTWEPQVISLQLNWEEAPKLAPSSEIREISKNAFFHRTPPVAASDSNSNKITTMKNM